MPLCLSILWVEIFVSLFMFQHQVSISPFLNENTLRIWGQLLWLFRVFASFRLNIPSFTWYSSIPFFKMIALLKYILGISMVSNVELKSNTPDLFPPEQNTIIFDWITWNIQYSTISDLQKWQFHVAQRNSIIFFDVSTVHPSMNPQITLAF